MKNRFSYLSGVTRSFALGDNNFDKNKKTNTAFYLPLAIIVIVILVLLFFVFRNTTALSTTYNDDQRIDVQKPKATQTLNKNFSFPLKDDKGKEVSKIKYTLLTAELRNEIIVKGKEATAVKGRTFLILNLKITNDFDKTITINTRDYVRLIVNNNNEKLAPDIHNDPVEIQADSTKYTRVGFPIDDTDKNLTLIVGEINGPKQTIKLNLK